MDELTTPERQRDSGTGANDGYTDLEMIEKDNKTLRERVAELEAQLEQRETFYKSEMQRERDNYNAAIKNANNIIAQLKEYERGAWNAAIEAALDVCERMRERFVILEQDERTSYEARHDNGTIAVSLMQATNAIKNLLK